MNAERVAASDQRIQSAVIELQGLIKETFPNATFEAGEGEDPEGIYLTATVDTDDLTTVLGIVEDRLVDLQVGQELPLYLVPVRPMERVERELRQPKPRVRPRIEKPPPHRYAAKFILDPTPCLTWQLPTSRCSGQRDV